MRKNQIFAKDMRLYSTFEISGLNLDRFINTVKNRGITLYRIKKYSLKRMRVTVNLSECSKFFAIAEELCYNIKKIKDGGALYPLYSLFSSIGVIIGSILFALTAIMVNDVIFSVDYSGSGIIYQREVQEYLISQGVEKYSRFSEIDLGKLEDGILASNEHLSFASCVKRGNRLSVDLVLSTERVKTLDGNVYAMYSDFSGVVESVKVYRGTAKVKVGDFVEKGTLLVDGVATVKEQTIKINVLASVTLVVEDVFEYRSVIDNQEEKAELFALLNKEEEEVVSSVVEKTEDSGEFIYKVTVKYRRYIYAG